MLVLDVVCVCARRESCCCCVGERRNKKRVDTSLLLCVSACGEKFREEGRFENGEEREGGRGGGWKGFLGMICGII